MALDYNKMSKEILQYIGGKDNLTSVNHCATRLRLGIKSTENIDKKKLTQIEGVLGVEIISNQVQVIVGQIIEDLYNAFGQVAGFSGARNVENKQSVKKRKNIGTLFVEFLELVAKIMAPVIPALICAGFFSLIIIVAQMLFHLKTTDSTYIILNSLGQTALYFLPVMVAYSSAKQFDTDPILSIMLACFLLYPDWNNLVAKGSATGFTSYFGLPVHLQTYNGQVVQIILSIWIMSLLDRWLKKIIPNSIRYFLKPVSLLLLMSIITLTLTGPLGGLFTNGISTFIEFLRKTVPWLTVPAIYTFAMTVGVFMPGFHLALIPIATQNLSTLGYDDIINIWFMAGTLVPGFVALWVALKSKNIKGRNISWTAAISALFGGVSEPTLYGILYKMPVLYAVDFVTGLILSIYNGIVGTKAYAYGAYYLTNLLLFYNAKDPNNLIKAIGGIVLVAIVSFIGVWFTKWSWNDDAKVDQMSLKSIFNRKKSDNDTNRSNVSHKFKEAKQLSNLKSDIVSAPVIGKIISQSEIRDHAFSSGSLGSCFGVKPESDDIYSPIDGKVNSIAPTKHAITIKGDHGDEVMLHLTLDSMKLQPNDISVLIKSGDQIAQGQKIAVLHREQLKKRELDDTVIVVLLNSSKYKNVKFEKNKLIAEI